MDSCSNNRTTFTPTRPLHTFCLTVPPADLLTPRSLLPTRHATHSAAATYVFFAPAPGASVTSSALQVYQSYISPPTFTPGQFKNFDTLSAVTVPFG